MMPAELGRSTFSQLTLQSVTRRVDGVPKQFSPLSPRVGEAGETCRLHLIMPLICKNAMGSTCPVVTSGVVYRPGRRSFAGRVGRLPEGRPPRVLASCISDYEVCNDWIKADLSVRRMRGNPDWYVTRPIPERAVSLRRVVMAPAAVKATPAPARYRRRR